MPDSIVSESSQQIGSLFAIMVSLCFPSNPSALWDPFGDGISQDIFHLVHTNFTPEILNKALILIENMCLMIAIGAL